MEYVGAHIRPNRSKPTWLTQQELAPVDTSTPPRWLYLRNGKTPNGFDFKMTLEEYKRIHRGSNERDRAYIINFYNKLINYFNQLDYAKPAQLNNFFEWKTWWGKSLDLVIPKSDLVDEYRAIFYKSDKHKTDEDINNLNRLKSQISPKPVLDPDPTILDLGSHSRFPQFKFVPYEWVDGIEDDLARYTRINRAGNKYKRTKRHKKFRKYNKKYNKKYTKSNKNIHKRREP